MAAADIGCLVMDLGKTFVRELEAPDEIAGSTAIEGARILY